MQKMTVYNDSKCEIGSYELGATDGDIAKAIVRCIISEQLVFEIGDTIKIEDVWSEEE